ncbi:MAG: lytic transglycosylase domain-containing protein [Bdellovibrionales bacterium]
MTSNRPQKIISFLLAVLVLSACGTAFRASPQLELNGQNLRTGALNKDEKPYTTFSATPNYEKLDSQIPKTTEAKLFAASIEKARFNSQFQDGLIQNNEMEVQIFWKGITEPQVLKGQLTQWQNQQGPVYGAKLQTVSGHQSDIYIDATCESVSCEVIQSLIKSSKTNDVLGGIMFHNEERILKTQESEEIDPNKMSRQAREFYLSHKQGTAVKVRASTIVNGTSQYEVTEPVKVGDNLVDQTILKGDLVSPEGDKIDLSETAGAIKSIGRTDLVGNDEENGELIFLQEDTAEDTPTPVPTPPTSLSPTKPLPTKPAPGASTPTATTPSKPRAQFVFSLERPKPAAARAASKPAPAPGVSDKPIRIDQGLGKGECTIAHPSQNSPQVEATIQSIMKDCAPQDPTIYARETKAQFFRKYRKFLQSDLDFQLINVLNIHKTMEKQTRHEENSDAWGFQLMLNQMKQANHAGVLAAAMTVVETGFMNLGGAAGECGVMQFMKATARDRGLTNLFNPIWGKVNGKQRRVCRTDDDRVIFRKAMPAFARHITLLNSYFPNNALMITASYNGGQGAAQDSQETVEARLKSDKKLRSLSPAEIKLMSNNFFWHKARGTLNSGAIAHTGKVAAAVQLLLNTQVYDEKIRPYPSMKAE